MAKKIMLNNLNTLIHDCDYIKKFKPNKSRAQTSLSYIVNRTLSQSDCIKLGNAVEKLLINITSQFTKYKNIKPPNKKGEKEKDILFINEKDKVIYYTEVKSNLDLDTEKSKATYNKCIKCLAKFDWTV